MAKRNQVTADLRINATAELNKSRSFITQLEKITDNFDFGERMNNQLNDATKKLKECNKILEKGTKNSFLSDVDLKNVAKAAKEIANIVSKTEGLYSGFNSADWQKYFKEYIKQVKAQEEAVAKIKNDFLKETGKNLDKEIANYSKLVEKTNELQKAREKLAKTGVEEAVVRQIEQTTEKLEQQRKKIKEINDLKEKSSKTYNDTLNKEASKRGYKDYNDLKNRKVLSENQIKKNIGTEVYKEEKQELDKIIQARKEIEKSKKNNAEQDQMAVDFAKKENIENVKNLATLKEEEKIRKNILNTYKDNKIDLAIRKQEKLNQELEKANKLAKDKQDVANIANQKELDIIQKGGYSSKASLSASYATTNRTINNLGSQLTESGIENITNEATNKITAELQKIDNAIMSEKAVQDTVENYMSKLATQSERFADEQDVKDNGRNTIENVNKNTDKDGKSTRDAINSTSSQVEKVLEGIKAPKGKSSDWLNESIIDKAQEESQAYVKANGQSVMLSGLNNINKAKKELENYLQMVEQMEKIPFSQTEKKENFRKRMEQAVKDTYDDFTKGIEENLADIRSFIGETSSAMNKKLTKSGKVKKGYSEAQIQKDQGQIDIYQQDYSHFKEMMLEGNLELSNEDKYLKAYTEEIDEANRKLKDNTEIKKENNNVDLKIEESGKEVKKFSDNVQKATEQSQYLSTTFDDIKNKVGYFLSLNYVFDQVIKKVSEASETVKTMDRDMTQIGLVLGKTSNQVWKNFNTYSQMAERLNTTTSQVTNSMKLFYQQGLNTSEVNKMVEASAIAAALGETSMAEASETLTSIINSYNLSAKDAMTVTDKISQIAIVSAADFQELSTAIEKVASSASSAGLDLDHMMGYLAKIIETTREAPTNVGTALKTIVANFTQFKEDPSGLGEEGTAINDVDTALKSVGISLTDTQGEVRDLGDVLDDLGGKWQDLTRNQKSYLATQIAGTRQQSRFYALMNDYDRTLELVTEGSNSAGKAQQQFALYSNSLEASANRLNNQWEIFFNQITQGNGIISTFNNTLTSLMKIVNLIGPIGAVLGLGSLTKSLRGAITEFNNLNNLVEKRQTDKENARSSINDIKESNKKTSEEKEEEIAEVRNSLNKERKEEYDKLTKAEKNYLISVENINEEQEKLNNKFKDSNSFTDKFKLSLGTAQNNIKKFGASSKLAFTQVKKAAVSLTKDFALLLVASMALKAVGAIVNGIKSSLGTNTETFVANAEKAQENKENIDSLSKEYETLSQKVIRTADEEARLKEITEEVTKVDAKLGQQLKDNAANYTANVKAMKEYSAEQEKIAAMNTAKSIRSESGWTKGLGLLLNGDYWTSVFGSNNDKQQLINAQQSKWRELGNARGIEEQLNSTQISMLNKFVEKKISSLENNKYGYLGYQASTKKFDNAVQDFIHSLKKLTTDQQKAYDTYLSHMSDGEHTYEQISEEFDNLNLPQELKSSLGKQLSEFFTLINNRIKNDKYISDPGTALDNATTYLSYTDMEKLFNPDTSTMSTEEAEYFARDRGKFIQNTDLVKEFSAAEKKGGEAIADFAKKISATGEYSNIFISQIYDINKAISTADFEKAITNFSKLADIDIDSLMKGTASQLSILEALGKGLLDLKDIIVATNGTIAVNNAAIIKKQQEQLDIIFNTLSNQIAKRKEVVDGLTDESNNKNLKKTHDTLDKLDLARVEKNSLSYYGNAEDYGGISGNIDLNDREKADLGNGVYGTENSITISADLGDDLGEMQYIIPTIVNGIQQSEEDAIAYFQKTGEFIAAFTTDTAEETVEAYANAIHERNQEWYAGDQDKASRLLNSAYGSTYEGGYDGSKQTYQSGVRSAGGFYKTVNVANESTDDLKFIISRFDKSRNSVGDEYQVGDAEKTIRSEYAKRTVNTGVQDTSSMTQDQKVDYIQKQNAALEEAKSKVDTLDKKSQEYYDTTYKIYTIQDDLKKVYSSDEDLMKNLNKTTSQLNDEADATTDAYDAQKEAAKGVQTELKKQLQTESDNLDKVKDKLSENLNYQKSYAGFFDGLTMDNTLMSQLDAVRTAYQQLGDTITDTDQLQSTLASNPSLIQALDATADGLTWNKEKLEEMGIQSIDTSYNYIESRIAEMETTKATLEKQSDDIKDWEEGAVERTASVITGNNSLTNTQQSNAQAEATNLGISEQSWIDWSDGVCKAIAAAGEEYNKFIKSQANNTEASYTNGYTASIKTDKNPGGTKGSEDAKKQMSQEEITKAKTDIANTLKKTGYSADKKGAIANINKQIELLRGLQRGLKYKKTNIGDYLGGKLYDNSGSGGSSDKNFDATVEKLEHFYNYLRQIEALESKISKVQAKRGLIDATQNYFLDNLAQENALLKEQSALYGDYIKDEKDYLATMRDSISSLYGDWAYFNKEGVIQVKQTEFNINSEDEQKRYEEFSEILSEYQNEYNTMLENQNKLYEIQSTVVENINSMYDKQLQKLKDVSERLEYINSISEHRVTMEFGSIKKLDLINDQVKTTAKMLENAQSSVNALGGDFNTLSKIVEQSAFKSLLTWDETLQKYLVNNSAMENENIRKQFEAQGYNWESIVTWVNATAGASQKITDNLKEANTELMNAQESLKSLLDDRLSTIDEIFSKATDEIDKFYKIYEDKISKLTTNNDLFGTESSNLEQQYTYLTSMAQHAKALLGGLQKNSQSILNTIMKDYGSYIQMVDGTAYINKMAIEESSTLTEKQKADLLQLYELYTNSQDQIEEVNSKFYDYISQIKDLEEAKRDAIIDLKNQLHDALKEKDQKEIDDLSEKYQKMSQLDSEYYSKLQQRISDARDARSRLQDQQDLTQMQNRLSILQRDNSGQYNSELIDLQKQINDKLQQQADSQVDLEMERIQREQEQRQEDRDMQITQMENLLTFKDENGIYWKEAQKLIDGGTGSVIGFLSSTEDVQKLNDEERRKQLEALKTSANTANATLSDGGWFTDDIQQKLKDLVEAPVSNLPTDIETNAESITNAIMTATTTFITTMSKLFDYLGIKIDDKPKGDSTTGILDNNGVTNPPQQQETQPSSGSSSPSNAGTASAPPLEKGSYVEVKPGTRWHYDSYGANPTGTARNGTIKYINPRGSYPYNIEGLGWVKKTDIVGYNKGGYVNYTGIAAVHGKANKPEAFLNARQTALFETLRDALVKVPTSINTKETDNSETVTIENLAINVKELADTDSIDKVVKTVKESIYKDAVTGNNMKITRRR